MIDEDRLKVIEENRELMVKCLEVAESIVSPYVERLSIISVINTANVLFEAEQRKNILKEVYSFIERKAENK